MIQEEYKYIVAFHQGRMPVRPYRRRQLSAYLEVQLLDRWWALKWSLQMLTVWFENSLWVFKHHRHHFGAMTLGFPPHIDIQDIFVEFYSTGNRYLRDSPKFQALNF